MYAGSNTLYILYVMLTFSRVEEKTVTFPPDLSLTEGNSTHLNTCQYRGKMSENVCTYIRKCEVVKVICKM
jgi:hypothetical protein